MKHYAKITPEGTRDYLFEECHARETVQQSLTHVFALHGYAPVATPTLEFYDVFGDQYADFHYHSTDSRGRLLVLRADSTLPIARIAATRLQKETLPLRLYYHQSVFRRSRFYAGHSDEFMQCGVELLGADGLCTDLEILSCAVEALRACDAPNFRIELGHVDFFACFVDELGVDPNLRALLAEAIGSKNYPALAQLLEPFEKAPAAQALLALPKLFGGEDVLTQAYDFCKPEKAAQALDYLAKLYAQLKQLGLDACIDIDLGLVRRQGFYTGLVFRGYMEGSGKPVLSGGRYDNLLADFGRDAAAVGFAVQLDPLAEALLEEGKCPEKPAVQALIFAEKDHEAAAILEMRNMHQQGKSCMIAPCETHEDALNFAKERGIAEVIVMQNA